MTLECHPIPVRPTGVLRSDDRTLAEAGEVLQTCEQSGDDFALSAARQSTGFAMIHHDTADSDRGVALLEQVRDQILQGRYSLAELPQFNLYVARAQARRGDRDRVLPSMRAAADQLFSSGPYGYCLAATKILVETLLEADTSNELSEAEMAIDRLAVSSEHQPIRDIMVLRLRTLLAKARNDDAAYRDLRERYRAMANSFGYEGHIAWAEAMP
jgi:adenylate cyclase